MALNKAFRIFGEPIFCFGTHFATYIMGIVFASYYKR